MTHHDAVQIKDTLEGIFWLLVFINGGVWMGVFK